MVVARRASNLNSLLCSNKISLVTRERTPRPCTGINNVEYKLLLRTGINNVEYKLLLRTGINNVEYKPLVPCTGINNVEYKLLVPCTGINNVEYKLHYHVQGLIMLSINSTTMYRD